MSKFQDIQDSKDFLALNSERASILVALSKLTNAFEKLSKDKPSLVAFQRNVDKLDSRLEQLESASDAVTKYFSSLGGDTLNDDDFIKYCDVETEIVGNLEILRESHYELLKSHNLLEPPAPVAPLQETVTQAGLLEALKVLAQGQTSATEKLAEATASNFKSPILPVPIFNPLESRNDPLAWTTFWSKFELFSENCADDKARLGFLFTAVKNDALKVIKGLKCTKENFAVAKKLLEDEYNKPDSVREMLLLKCVNFRMKNKSDFSELNSAMIDLKVNLNELKSNHGVDILNEAAASNILRAIIHDMLPGKILSMYQSLSKAEYPSLDDFLTKFKEVADHLILKHKNEQKNSGSKSSNNAANSKATPSTDVSLSTIPTNVSAVAKTMPPKSNKPRKKRFCFF